MESTPSAAALAAEVQRRAITAAEAVAAERAAAQVARAVAAAVSSYDCDLVKTPLHPYVRGQRPGTAMVHKHALYVVATGYVNPAGVPYDRWYCLCGVCFKTERTQP